MLFDNPVLKIEEMLSAMHSMGVVPEMECVCHHSVSTPSSFVVVFT